MAEGEIEEDSERETETRSLRLPLAGGGVHGPDSPFRPPKTDLLRQCRRGAGFLQVRFTTCLTVFSSAYLTARAAATNALRQAKALLDLRGDGSYKWYGGAVRVLKFTRAGARYDIRER